MRLAKWPSSYSTLNIMRDISLSMASVQVSSATGGTSDAVRTLCKY